MPLIQKPQQVPEKKQLRVRMGKEIFNEIQSYCSWAGVELDYFLEQAALMVFEKDKHWKDQKRQLPKKIIESVTV